MDHVEYGTTFQLYGSCSIQNYFPALWIMYNTELLSSSMDHVEYRTTVHLYGSCRIQNYFPALWIM